MRSTPSVQQMGRDKLYVEADNVRSLAANFDLRFRTALYERLRELLRRERRKLLSSHQSRNRK